MIPVQVVRPCTVLYGHAWLPVYGTVRTVVWYGAVRYDLGTILYTEYARFLLVIVVTKPTLKHIQVPITTVVPAIESALHPFSSELACGGQ